jgi:hypothetical protein
VQILLRAPIDSWPRGGTGRRPRRFLQKGFEVQIFKKAPLKSVVLYGRVGSNPTEATIFKFAMYNVVMSNITDKEFIEAVKNSFSIRTVLQKLNIKEAGGNYKTFYSKIARLNLDISHFTGQGHLKNKCHNWSKKMTLGDILKENSYYNSHRLKLRLIKEGIKNH